jgi:hypothetical protein
LFDITNNVRRFEQRIGLSHVSVNVSDWFRSAQSVRPGQPAQLFQSRQSLLRRTGRPLDRRRLVQPVLFRMDAKTA